MIVASLLVAYALGAAVVGRRVLERAAWPSRAPVLGIWSWQALTWSIAGALVMAVLVLSLPVMPFRESVARALEACSMSLVSHYTTPGGNAVAWMALTLGIGLALRPLGFFAADSLTCAKQRRHQRRGLGLLAAPDSLGITNVEHDLPLVYCLPGRRSAIVVTSGARRRLTDDQLALVIGHEVAHLRARHHWALSGARALSRGFGRASVFVRAESAIAALVEMQADDAATTPKERRELARALVALSPHTVTSTAGALGSAGTASLARARRLTTPNAPLTLRVATTAGFAGVLLVALPLALAFGPGVESAVRDCCHAVAVASSGE